MRDIVERIWNKYLGVNTPAAELAKAAATEIESLRRELAEARQEIADRETDCATGHDQDEATIAELCQQLAEKDAEIERLKLAANIGKSKDVRALSEILLSDCGCSTEHLALLDKVENRLWTFFDEQLAAIQAVNQQYREVLAAMVSYAREEGKGLYIADEALALPQDTSALSAMITKACDVMRDRCAQSGMLVANNGIETAGSIRSIPSVTLEDLK